MSIMPNPPTGFSHAHRGLVNAAAGHSRLKGNHSEFEANLIDSVLFQRHFYDFDEATMPIDQVGVAGLFVYEESGANTDFVKVAPTATLQSHIIADILVDNSQVALMTPAMFLSGQNPWIEVGFQLESITNLGIQIGFSDPGPASAGKIISDIDTPAVDAAVTDCAIACIDTDQTLKTLALVSKDGTTVTAVTGCPTAAPHGIPTLATNVVYRVELRGQIAYCFVNGTLVATGASGSGPQGSVLLEAVIQFGNLDAADKEVHIDYIDVGQERLVTPF